MPSPARGVSKGFSEGVQPEDVRDIWRWLRFLKGCPWFCELGADPLPFLTTDQAIYVAHTIIMSINSPTLSHSTPETPDLPTDSG